MNLNDGIEVAIGLNSSRAFRRAIASSSPKRAMPMMSIDEAWSSFSVAAQGTSGGHSHFQLCGGVAVGLVQFDPSTLGCECLLANAGEIDRGFSQVLIGRDCVRVEVMI